MSKERLIILIILYLAFISLGLPDQALGVAWPSIRRSFLEPLEAAGLIVLITSITGGLAGFASGYFIKKYSVAQILIASAFLTSAGMFGYAFSPTWAVLLLATMVLGIGAGTIDASLNNYVSENYSSRHLIWLHGFWGIGATLGPSVMSLSLAKMDSWRMGYLIIAIIQLLLGLVFILSAKVWKNTVEHNKPKFESDKHYKLLSAAPLMTLGVFIIEGVYLTCLNVWFYSLLVDKRAMAASKAGLFIVSFWTSLTIGRFVLGFIAPYFGNKAVLRICLFGLVLASSLLLATNDYGVFLALCMAGVCLSGIYPTLMYETPRRYGSEFAKFMTGYQAGAGILGLSVIVPLIGIILGQLGLQYLPWILILLSSLAYIITKKVYRL